MVKYLSKFKKINENIYQDKINHGYWSNLTAVENKNLLNLAKKETCKSAVKKLFPKYYETIFSEKRVAGTELLQLNGTETVIDLGCMWGALSIPLAKQVKQVVSVDQTLETLKFASKRAQEQNLNNIVFINSNLRHFSIEENAFDIAIVNGVMEWIPETNEIIVDEYLEKSKRSPSGQNPREIQLKFLKGIKQGLRKNGKIYLAIENRYDYKMFFGEEDPHSGLLFTTILPKSFANIISLLFRRRRYKTWIYSFNETIKLLKEAGFNNFQTYSCWPNYRMPDHIIPHGTKSKYFKPINIRKNGRIKFKRLIANRIEWLLFYKLNLQFFSPSIIIIAK